MSSGLDISMPVQCDGEVFSFSRNLSKPVFPILLDCLLRQVAKDYIWSLKTKWFKYNTKVLYLFLHFI